VPVRDPRRSPRGLKIELVGEIERKGREGGPEEGWPEIEGTGMRMARGLTYAGAMKFMRRLPFFTCVRCKTLDGVIST
jgi:hypothetical protein